jgi:hypothetical protein
VTTAIATLGGISGLRYLTWKAVDRRDLRGEGQQRGVDVQTGEIENLPINSYCCNRVGSILLVRPIFEGVKSYGPPSP